MKEKRHRWKTAVDLKQSLVVHREELLFTSTYRFLSTRNDTNDLTDSTALSLDEDYDLLLCWALLLLFLLGQYINALYQKPLEDSSNSVPTLNLIWTQDQQSILTQTFITPLSDYLDSGLPFFSVPYRSEWNIVTVDLNPFSLMSSISLYKDGDTLIFIKRTSLL